MVNVNPIDGIKYGFRLMGYMLVVYIVGFITIGVGGLLVEGDSALVGGLIVLVGFLTILAGFSGIMYKVIADGVEKGVVAANERRAGRNQPAGGSQRGRQQGGQRQSGQQQQSNWD